MPDSIVRKTAGSSWRCTEVNQKGIVHLFASVEPQNGHSLSEQLQEVLQTVGQLFDCEHGGTVLHLTVFLAKEEKVAACRQMVRAFFKDQCPATSYVSQPPCSGKRIAVEAMGMKRCQGNLNVRRISDQVVVAQHNGTSWVYVDQVGPRTSSPGVYEQTICSFQNLRRLLPMGGARFDQVLRTWLCLGDIVDSEGPTQRYKEMNRARSDVFEHSRFMGDQLPEDYHRRAFPASTGIGTEGRSLCVSALAVVSDCEDSVAVPLENPRQTAAYDYSPTYSPSSPLFSRGLAYCHGADTTLLISGTASITNAETRHCGDVVAQTSETLDNIASLIGEENLHRHNLPGRGTTLEGLAVARVYVKHQQDYADVRALCESRLGSVPVTYVVADVCRSDLLVEIEGIAFSRLDGSSDTEPLRRRTLPQTEARTVFAHGTRAPYCPVTCPERDDCVHAVMPDEAWS